MTALRDAIEAEHKFNELKTKDYFFHATSQRSFFISFFHVHFFVNGTFYKADESVTKNLGLEGSALGLKSALTRIPR